MPFYEYECSSCKFSTEVMQKISDAPLRKCPSCGKNTLKKLISAPVFRLKGAGWYETDFKSDKENQRNLADREEKTDKVDKVDKPDSDAKAKPETAPADKTERKPQKKSAAGTPPRKARPAKAKKKKTAKK